MHGAYPVSQFISSASSSQRHDQVPVGIQKENMLDSFKLPADGQFGWKRLAKGLYGNMVPDAPGGDWTKDEFVERRELVSSLGACIYGGNKCVSKE